VRLHELVDTSRAVAATSGRRAKVERLAALLARLAPDEIPVAVGFLVGAARQGRLGIGPAAVREAMAAAAAPRPSLEILEVDRAFERIAGLSGAGSARERVRQLTETLSRATPEEQRFLAGLVLGEVRHGALEGLMAEAVARAGGLAPATMRRAVMLTGDLGGVARTALVEGEAGLAGFGIELFRPLQPMLAQTADDVGGAIDRLGEAAFEAKLDGARVQVHKAGSDVRVFSRRLNDVTAAVPEIVEAVAALPAREAILDGEVIALRPDGFPHPFQVTMRRFGRRLDVEGSRASLPLTPFLFDVLHLDGASLLDAPLAERWGALAGVAPPDLLVPREVTGSVEAAAAFFDAALERGHEGVMAKALDAPYEAGGRGFAWLKVKPAHTLDLVVLAAEWGHGRRKGWLSNLHLGARDEERGGFVMLGKTFKGMTDAMLAWQTAAFLKREIARDEWTVYVRPELVVEVAFNDVQASPHYPGGLALRFARIKRYRPDKSAGQADTLGALRSIYRKGTGQEPPPRP
jgi:DNA ligase-1